MIKNSKQYNATKEYAARFKASLEELEAQKSEMDNLEFEFSYNSYLYQYNELLAELEEYDNLKTTNVLKERSIDRIAEVLIQARIAKGWTQAELAEKLGIDAQQIQRYEANDYESASLARIFDVINIMELNIELKDIVLPNSEYKIPISVQEKQEDLTQINPLLPLGQ